MVKIWALILLSLLFCNHAFSQGLQNTGYGLGTPSISKIQTSDGLTSCYPSTLEVSPATLTCNPNGTAIVTSGGGGGSGNVGIGTTGRIPVFLGPTTIGSPYNNTMDSNGNLGIGAASPDHQFVVKGLITNAADGVLSVENSSTGHQLAYLGSISSGQPDAGTLWLNNVGSNTIKLQAADGSIQVNNPDNSANNLFVTSYYSGADKTEGYVGISQSNSQNIQMTGNHGSYFNSGNFSIGNTNRSFQLGVGSTNQFNVDASGNVGTSGGYTQSGTTADTFSGTSSFTNASIGILVPSGNVGINSATPGSRLDVQGTIRILGSGNVGIGTASPGSLLDVAGLSRFRTTAPQVESFSSATSITPTGSYRFVYMANTQGAGTFTVNNPTNNGFEGQSMVLKISSTAVQTFSWGTKYNGGTVALPTSTLGTSTIEYFSFVWDAVNSHWDCTGNVGGFN